MFCRIAAAHAALAGADRQPHRQLPSSIGQCPRLQKLMLAGNRLRALPPELAACRNLDCCACRPMRWRRFRIGC
jgi:hypothetical protein